MKPEDLKHAFGRAPASFRREVDEVLKGLGESAAVPIVEARKNGDFLSVEDLKTRGRVGSSVIELLRAHGALEGMTETNQLSMF